MTPAFVHEEIENYEGLVVEKSGMEPDRVAQFIDLPFQYIEVVPADEFYPAIERADEAIGNTDPDDVLYLACAIDFLIRGQFGCTRIPPMHHPPFDYERKQRLSVR